MEQQRKIATNRNEYMDTAKGVLIFLVTLGHTIQGFTGGGGYGDFFMNHLFRLIYSFHMPAFMAISGYFFYYSYCKRDGKEVIVHKVLTILLPVISWNAFGYLFLYLPENIHKLDSPEALIKSVLSYATLWFLVSVFINSALIVAFTRLYRRIPVKWINRPVFYLVGMLLLCLIPFGKQYVFMIPYFVIGYLMAQKGINMTPDKISRAEIVISVLFMVLLCFYSKEDYIYTTGICIFQSDKQIWINIYRWVTGAAGIVFFSLWMKLFNRLGMGTGLKSLLIRAGENTLVIYSIQTLIIFHLVSPVGAFLAGRWAVLAESELLRDIVCFCMAVLLTYGMTILAELLRRNRITSLLFCGSGRSSLDNRK